MPKRITAPLDFETAQSLRSGDSVLLSGTIYTARDAAHKRLCELAAENKPMPFPMEGAVIYYAGPTPPPPRPPTSYRMDAYAPTLLRLGELGMIGKGSRGPEVIDAMKETGAVYFGAIGGAGALLARCVKSAELICYEDLGAEAVRRLEVKDLPLTVVIDSLGNDLYQTGRAAYLAWREQQEA